MCIAYGMGVKFNLVFGSLLFSLRLRVGLQFRVSVKHMYVCVYVGVCVCVGEWVSVCWCGVCGG